MCLLSLWNDSKPPKHPCLTIKACWETSLAHPLIPLIHLKQNEYYYHHIYHMYTKYESNWMLFHSIHHNNNNNLPNDVGKCHRTNSWNICTVGSRRPSMLCNDGSPRNTASTFYKQIKCICLHNTSYANITITKYVNCSPTSFSCIHIYCILLNSHFVLFCCGKRGSRGAAHISFSLASSFIFLSYQILLSMGIFSIFGTTTTNSNNNK